jgi:hypothetical protein
MECRGRIEDQLVDDGTTTPEDRRPARSEQVLDHQVVVGTGAYQELGCHIGLTSVVEDVIIHVI